jgi:hypothetical protein
MKVMAIVVGHRSSHQGLLSNDVKASEVLMNRITTPLDQDTK